MKINNSRQEFYGVSQTASVNKLARATSWMIAGILALLPFHAFITVWLASAVGHYTLLRLWKELLMVFVLAGTIYILAADKPLRQKLWNFWPARLIAIYSALLLAWAGAALAKDDVTAKAMWYGLLLNLRFLIFFLVVWVIAAKSNFLARQWKKILLVPAMLVSAFAILQYLVLPYDFLKHFGYSAATIDPYETINNNINRLRVFSTLRGANPLGAYLVIPLSALAFLLIKHRSKRKEGVLLFGGLLLALIFSFSRSAWIGAALGLLAVAWALLKSRKARKMLALSLAGLVIFGGLLAVGLRNNATFQNAIFHTDSASKIAISSNEGRVSALKAAANDIARQPLGSGVGTAGPASVYNQRPARIAENYYLQIGQEAGIAGMVLFIAICAMVGKLLWNKRAGPLALWLLASLIGISFINLLSHAWTDDTLAYIWWGLAGLALATHYPADKRSLPRP